MQVYVTDFHSNFRYGSQGRALAQALPLWNHPHLIFFTWRKAPMSACFGQYSIHVPGYICRSDMIYQLHGQKHGTIQNIMGSKSTSLKFSECVADHLWLSSAVSVLCICFYFSYSYLIVLGNHPASNFDSFVVLCGLSCNCPPCQIFALWTKSKSTELTYRAAIILIRFMCDNT